MVSFRKTGTISEFYRFLQHIYGEPDDRLYSIWDILTQQQRFTMRALKGVRKNDMDKLKLNLLIAFSWSPANRLHIDIEDELWKRFPYMCSYCGKLPCECKLSKITRRKKVKVDEKKRPHGLSGFQKMFRDIYPPESRTLADAGVHLAEEMGEVAEAIHNYLGQHLETQFQQVKEELADFASCIFAVANSANIDMAQELSKLYRKNCHVCHKLPCVCTFAGIANFKS